jgi:hypothetical protein
MTESSDDEGVHAESSRRLQDDNHDLPALFWDAMPSNAEDNSDFAALQALKEECTPRERAESFKVRF